MKGNRTAGRFSALLTIIIWGTTFISTKILLADFPPVQILCFRFAMGLLALLIVYPRRLKGTNRHQELTFAAAGLRGICLYYLLENSALTYTMASNVGVIISVAPFFTAILCRQRKSAAMATTPFSPPGGWSATASCLCSRYGSCDYSGDFRGNSP